MTLLARSLLLLLSAGGLAAQITNPVPAKIPPGIAVELEDWLQLPVSGSGATRARLSVMRPAYDGSGRIFINDLRGRLYVIVGEQPSIYLDFKAAIGNNFVDTPGLGTGFHAFVFHPEFATNGKFYTAHTERPGSGAPDFGPPVAATIRQQTIITEWTAESPAANTFAGPRRELLRVDFPGTKHAFQDLGFNPNVEPGDPDYGMLYLALGDAAAVEEGHPEWAHRLDSVLGTLLRIDPAGDNAANGRYGIPGDNPLVDDGDPATIAEIWAWGLRNPHRMSWDREGAREMFIGDIGERSLEEVNLGRAGADYGYSLREGTFAMRVDVNPDVVYPLPEDDEELGFTYPIAQFDHDEGRAIAPGFVYRGAQVPELYGQYIFGDIVSGRVFYIDADAIEEGELAEVKELQLLRNGEPRTLLSLVGQSRTDLRFGTDEAGELYLTTKGDGKIRRVRSVNAEPEPRPNIGRLVNVSTRGLVGQAGDILIGGFVVGEGPRQVLIRAVGPTLGTFGVPNVLVDPRLRVFRAGDDEAFAENDNWGANPNPAEVAAAASRAGSFGLRAGSKDAALVLTLDPGAYTVQVSGAGGTTGVALVEVYQLP